MGITKKKNDLFVVIFPFECILLLTSLIINAYMKDNEKISDEKIIRGTGGIVGERKYE